MSVPNKRKLDESSSTEPVSRQRKSFQLPDPDEQLWSSDLPSESAGIPDLSSMAHSNDNEISLTDLSSKDSASDSGSSWHGPHEDYNDYVMDLDSLGPSDSEGDLSDDLTEAEYSLMQYTADPLVFRYLEQEQAKQEELELTNPEEAPANAMVNVKMLDLGEAVEHYRLAEANFLALCATQTSFEDMPEKFFPWDFRFLIRGTPEQEAKVVGRDGQKKLVIQVVEMDEDGNLEWLKHPLITSAPKPDQVLDQEGKWVDLNEEQQEEGDDWKTESEGEEDEVGQTQTMT